ncbi:MAG: AAA family ATPase, partial [Burkholderiaceae bacterium]
MLRRLSLRDFVIVATLEVEFADGFSVLTGETGAGKSILLDAFALALGARGDAGVVREGAARAEIGAEFDAPASLSAWLDDGGFESGET